LSDSKISLICTVKNEESTIGDLIDALSKQTRKPDEVIIIDGGSTDWTPEIVREYASRDPKLKFFVEKGANISKGRNIAVSLASCDIIACTDAGNLPEAMWLERLIEPLEAGTADVASGAYIFYGQSDLEITMVDLTYVPIERWGDDFIPAGRSVAFTRDAWRKAGKFPEWLNAAEDTYFDFKAKEVGARFVLVKNAIVHYRVMLNFRELFKTQISYVKWDTVAGLYSRRGYLVVILFAIYLALMVSAIAASSWIGIVLLLILLPVYFIRFGIGPARKHHGMRFLYYGAQVGVALRLGEIFGLLSGLWYAFLHKDARDKSFRRLHH
jgi:glycosyltransferase involved in cell wall biosynthesis